jgi:ribokinase
MKILNYGSCCIDKVYSVQDFVKPGETIASLDFAIHPGGKGLNQSIAMANAGATVIHAGKLGDDGIWLKELLADKGVDVEALDIVDGPSGHANIQVSAAGENAIVIVGGSNRKIIPDDFERAFAKSEAGDFLLLQNEVSHLGDIIRFGHARGLRLVFNAAPMTPDVMDLPLELVEYFIVNETEAMALTDSETDDPAVLLEQLKLKFPSTNVILTLGSEGAIYQSQSETYTQSAFKTDAVDTTGAGDTFTGFFLAALAEGLDLPKCLELACKAASISVTRPGAASGIPSRAEVDG